ncbi:hypothetical protein PIB30_052236 [Stylosanthes scabra]|uniref:Zinc finger GRF-type domain-containing protein n=1 Tax=Stylosanthes scabra TaxID=79078 RepID=A0ABU6SIB4_9FABA|nr:hypothetical protein [Stylosanthes scabra]
MASSSKERWSGSNRDSGRDGGDGEGWSFSKASTQSGGASKKKSKFVAPECNCGAFAILFMSSTSENPNRLFYGCPYFKGIGGQAHRIRVIFKGEQACEEWSEVH